jgi:hypothetical protein
MGMQGKQQLSFHAGNFCMKKTSRKAIFTSLVLKNQYAPHRDALAQRAQCSIH